MIFHNFDQIMVDRVLSFLHGGSLQITYSFPLSFIMSLFVIWLKTTNRVVFWISGFLPFSQVQFSNMKFRKEKKSGTDFNELERWLNYLLPVQILNHWFKFINLKVWIGDSRFEPVVGSSATQLNFIKFGFRGHMNEKPFLSYIFRYR